MSASPYVSPEYWLYTGRLLKSTSGSALRRRTNCRTSYLPPPAARAFGECELRRDAFAALDEPGRRLRELHAYKLETARLSGREPAPICFAPILPATSQAGTYLSNWQRTMRVEGWLD